MKRDLQAALNWCASSRQPSGAMLFHLGIHAVEQLTVGGEVFYVSFMPDRRNGGAVLVLDMKNKYDETRPHSDPARFRSILLADWKLIENEVASVTKVVDRWNGPGCDSGSFRLDTKISPSLTRALESYSDGSIRCSRGKSCDVFCRCEVRRAAYAKLVLPIGWRS